MITKITEFKRYLNESLSNDRMMNFKKKQLEDAARQLVEAMKKLEIAEIARKQQNEIVKNVLEELDTHSIVCQGVLIQMVNGFESTRTDMKGYNEFVQSSIDTLGSQYMEMHEKITQIATKENPDLSYISTAKNAKNLPNGVVKEGMMDGIKKGFHLIVSKIKSFLSRSKAEVEEIQDELDRYISPNDQETDYFVPFYNEAKSVKKNLNYTDGKKFFYITLENGLYWTLNDSKGKVVKMLSASGEKEDLIKKYKLKLVPKADQKSVTINESLETEPQSEAIANALTEAKKLIEQTEEEKYYEELVKSKKQEIMNLLKEFNSKKYVIDEKILSVVTRKGGPKLSESEYRDKMINAEEVGEHVAEMAQSLFSLYTKTFEVSGSIRQYSDDTNLPDGTLGATFDWVFNTVTPPDNTVSEGVSSFIMRAIRKIKSYISNFRLASRRCDMALNQI